MLLFVSKLALILNLVLNLVPKWLSCKTVTHFFDYTKCTCDDFFILHFNNFLARWSYKFHQIFSKKNSYGDLIDLIWENYMICEKRFFATIIFKYRCNKCILVDLAKIFFYWLRTGATDHSECLYVALRESFENGSARNKQLLIF